MFHYYIEPKVIPDLLTEDDIEYIDILSYIALVQYIT